MQISRSAAFIQLYKNIICRVKLTIYDPDVMNIISKRATYQSNFVQSRPSFLSLMRGMHLFHALLLLLLSQSWAMGQQSIHVQGPYKLGSYSGEGDLHLAISGQDTVLSGPFYLRSTDATAFFSTSDNYFSLQGHYLDNVPTGLWNIEFGQFSSSGTATLEGYHYRVGLNGTQHAISGEVKEGSLFGTWTHTIQKITESAVEGVSFRSEIEFENGIPQQTFKIESDGFVLLGRFLRNGLAHDTWTLYSHVDKLEDWRFIDGKLHSIELIKGGQRTEVYRDANDQFPSKTTTLNGQYFQVLALYQQFTKKPSAPFTGQVAKLLAINSANYSKANSVLTVGNDQHFTPNFKVKLPHFPLTKNETAQLDSLAALLESTKTHINYLSNNSSLNIIRLTDKEVEQTMSILDLVDSILLAPAQILTSLQDHETLQYVDRRRLKQFLQLDANDADRVRPLYTPSFLEGDLISESLSLTQFSYQYIDSIRTVLNNKLNPQDRLQANSEIEVKLVRNMNLLDSLSNLNSTSQNAVQSISHIRSHGIEVLREYSTVRGPTPNPVKAQQTLDCLEKHIQLATAIHALPERWSKIQVEYTDKTWNNFTSTVMTENIKRRITHAYQNILLPHYFQHIKENITCNNILQIKKTFDLSYDRILALRKEDTKRLEKRLKREDDPSVIMQLFSIPTLL